MKSETMLAMNHFMEALNEMEAEHSKNFKYILPATYELNTRGSKNFKVIRDNSVYCFINKENGDIYKPAGWNAPAKDARANLLNYDSWMGKMDVYGGWLYKR